MMKNYSAKTKNLFATILTMLLFSPLVGCDLAENALKIDRTGDMEVQDYRDALAPRFPEPQNNLANRSNIPSLQPYVAQPSENLKPMPLVSISVNQTIPLRDVLFELADQADYDIELDPRIRGSIIFTARNRPFDLVIERISEIANLRYKFDRDSVRVELDTPYQKLYKVNYLSFVRTNESSINNNVAVVSGDGTDTGSRFQASSESEIDFWGELEANLTQILNTDRNITSLRTERDPRISAVPDIPAPVEPLTVDENGNIIEPVEPPRETILRVDSLPTDDQFEDQNQNFGEEDPFASRFSVNRQAGMVSVFATERLHEEVQGYLTELERAVTAQVLIEAKVLEVSLTDEFSAGIDWSILNMNLLSGGSNLSFGNTSVNAAAALNPATNPDSFLQFLYSGNDVNLLVEAINRFGTVKALASPRLTVLNNQSAVLNVADNQIYFEIDVDSTLTEGGIRDTDVDSEIRNVPEGVLINVQPSISLDDRSISLSLRPTVTRIISTVNDPGVAFALAEAGLAADAVVSAIPVVNVQEIDSVVQMQSGEAVVMGGLMQDRLEAEQNAVPVLGEIPVMGGLFRNQADRIQKTELVILIKATILDSPSASVHSTDRDVYRTFSSDRRPFRL